MKALIYSFVVLFFVSASLKADETAQYKSFRGYLESAIKREIQAAPDVWENAGAGGYLFCFKFDVNNDGNEELFVTSSLRTHDLTAEWTIFHKTPSGEYAPYRDKVTLPMTGFSVAVDGTSTTFVNTSSRGYKYYASYQTVVGDAVHTTAKEISEKEYDRLNSPGGVKQVIPKMKAIHLVDFLRDPKQNWINVDPTTLQDNETGFVRIPADAKRIKAFRLSPKAALQQIQQMKDASTP